MGMTFAAPVPDAAGDRAGAPDRQTPAGPATLPPQVQNTLARTPAASRFRVSPAGVPTLARATETDERKRREEKRKSEKEHPLGLPMPLMLVKNGIKPGEGMPAPLVKHSGGKGSEKEEENLGKVELPSMGTGFLNLKGGFSAGYKLDGSLTANLKREVNEDDMDKQADPVIDKLGLHGSVKAKGSVTGSVAAFVGFDAKIIGIEAGIEGSVRIAGTGDFSVNGGLTSKGDPDSSFKPWSGELDYSVNITADVIVAASGYFKWKLLWLGDKYSVKLAEWKAGTLTITGKGKMGYGTPPKLSDMKVKFTWGSIPKPQVTKEKQGLLGIGVLGLKRTAVSPPPEPPPGEGNRPTLRAEFPALARSGENEQDGPPPPPLVMPVVSEE